MPSSYIRDVLHRAAYSITSYEVLISAPDAAEAFEPSDRDKTVSITIAVWRTTALGIGANLPLQLLQRMGTAVLVFACKCFDRADVHHLQAIRANIRMAFCIAGTSAQALQHIIMTMGVRNEF